MRWIVVLVLIVLVLFAGYEFGKRAGRNDVQTQIIENYSFVREIAQLASLEASGMTTFKSTNLANDGSWTDAFKKAFIENSIQISVPYTAKYGIDLQDSTMRIVRKDSLIEIHLAQPKLLSYELHMDRIETSNKKGLLISPEDERYIAIQKKMYAQSRAQLEQNGLMLNQSRDKVCGILKKYFSSLGLQSVCIFNEQPNVISYPKN